MLECFSVSVKTVASAFHLHNVRAHRKLQVCLDGQRLMHDPYPKYLGMTLDRTLSFREHLVKTAGKLKNRNNLLMKLAGSSWGANAETLRSSALALCYAVAEYCAPCLVPLSSHKSGRCTAELHHATHFWNSTLYTAPLVTSSRQHRTTSPPKESCHGQAGDEGPHA